MEIKYRNVVVVYLLGFITFGIYFLYWMVKTKGEINRMGGDIPTSFLIIVPIANLYWIYKYCDCFSVYVKKDNNGILWFILYLVSSGLVMPAIVQIELNKYANGEASLAN